MEQLIKPNANSEKYIKETNLIISDFKTKIDSLEKQYISVIRNKNNDIIALNKKVKELNNIIASKNSKIEELEDTITDKELDIMRLENNCKTENVEVKIPQNINIKWKKN